MKLQYSFSENNEMALVHQKSLDILENVGMIYQCEEALETFRKAGLRVEGETVYIPRQVVEDALKLIPSSFHWYARRGNYIQIGGTDSANCIPSHGPIYVLDNGVYRRPTAIDNARFHKLNHTSEITVADDPYLIGELYVDEGHMMDKSYVSTYRMASTLMYTDKPVMGFTEGTQNSEMSIDMIQRFYDNYESVVAVGLVNIASPLRLSRDSCEGIIAYAKKKQAIVVNPGLSPGVSAPPSLGGVLTLGNAERLGCAVLAQLTNPGTPMIFGCSHNMTDLRYMSYAVGAPETALMALSAREVGNFYNVPVRTSGSLSDSKAVDYQAGMESFMSAFCALTARSDFMLFSLGLLDSFNSISYEKFILDEETITIARRLLRGYDVNEETIQYEKIAKIGPGGFYLDRTQRSYRRDYYLAKYAVRDPHNNWEADGCKTARDKALEACEKRIAGYVQPELTKAQMEIVKESMPEELINL